MIRFIATSALAASLLAACAPNQGPRTPSDRFFRSIGEKASPSEVIRTELAFARMAREDGQWTAFRKFAADNALLFGQNGAIEAKPWLRKQEDPAEAVQWEPHSVWASCDGSLAVTTGGFVDPEGSVGRFHTVWERQRNGEYLYLFDFGFPTDTAPDEPEMIASKVASCGQPATVDAEPDRNVRTSRDGTLAWTFHIGEDRERTFTVWQAGAEGTARVLDVAAPPASPAG